MPKVYSENVIIRKQEDDDKDRIISDLTIELANTTIRVSDMENLVNDLCTDLVNKGGI